MAECARPRSHRSIPARAGEPRASDRRCRRHRVYPRAGGGAWVWTAADSAFLGLSPRGRGSLDRDESYCVGPGSIPARAGEPAAAAAGSGIGQVYPRAGGGAQGRCCTSSDLLGLSPRGRGSRGGTAGARRRQGSIPARAGEPPVLICACIPTRVYPRAGGGALMVAADASSGWGLSPRGRGSPRQVPGLRPRHGSIPARAGEPATTRRKARNRGVYPRAGGGAVGLPLSWETQ